MRVIHAAVPTRHNAVRHPAAAEQEFVHGFCVVVRVVVGWFGGGAFFWFVLLVLPSFCLWVVVLLLRFSFCGAVLLLLTTGLLGHGVVNYFGLLCAFFLTLPFLKATPGSAAAKKADFPVFFLLLRLWYCPVMSNSAARSTEYPVWRKQSVRSDSEKAVVDDPTNARSCVSCSRIVNGAAAAWLLKLFFFLGGILRVRSPSPKQGHTRKLSLDDR